MRDIGLFLIFSILRTMVAPPQDNGRTAQTLTIESMLGSKGVFGEGNK